MQGLYECDLVLVVSCLLGRLVGPFQEVAKVISLALHVLLMEAPWGAEHPIFRFSWHSGCQLSVEALVVTPIKEAAEAKPALAESVEVEQVKEHGPLGKPNRL